MAYLRKRGTSWSYTIDIGADPVTGRRRQTTKGGFRTKREAELAAAKAESEVVEGSYVKEQNTSFREFTENWLKYYKSGVITKRPKPSSIRHREHQIKSLLKHFDSVKISYITRKQYQDALINLSLELSHNTVQGIHSTAKMIFRRAIQDNVIKVDPTEFAKVPQLEENEDVLPSYFEKEQLAEFLDLARNRGLKSDYATFLTLAYTGIRVGEVCVLKWSDIDSENCTISINGTLHNPEDNSTQYIILSPKTKSSKRTIDVDQVVINELNRLRSEQNEFKMLHRKTYHDADFVFGRMDKPRNAKPAYGYPPKRRTIEKRMDRIMQWMDVPFRATPHTLRHTHASLLAEAGASLEAIQDRLGHKDDRTTKLIYLHITKTVKKQTADKFGALMSSVVKM